MKKTLYFTVFIVFILGCTFLYETLTNAQKRNEIVEITEQYEISLESSLNQVKNPKAVSFIETSSGLVEVGTLITVTGEVDLVLTRGALIEFSVEVNESHGYGVYVVQDQSGQLVREGDKVKINGVYWGEYKHAPIPLIVASEIEFNE